MQEEDVIRELYNSVVTLDKEKAQKFAKLTIEMKFDILKVVELGLTSGVREIGRQFQNGKVYIPELALGGDVLQEAMNIFTPELIKHHGQIKTKGKIIFGTVKGDLHNIGKDLVVVLLRANGFEVIDLGVDVSTFEFVEKADSNNVNLIGLSALLTTTMPQQREVIEALKSEGLREKFKVIVGGGAVDENWAEEIGADGYGIDAVAAVQLATKLCR